MLSDVITDYSTVSLYSHFDIFIVNYGEMVISDMTPQIFLPDVLNPLDDIVVMYIKIIR